MPASPQNLTIPNVPATSLVIASIKNKEGLTSAIERGNRPNRNRTIKK
ncbi:MAG: hypothetical protein MZV64_23360 [Ignavibacteriales bacterium]|nr:hypothetical protein [Ignavibacteriales bacterium]